MIRVLCLIASLILFQKSIAQLGFSPAECLRPKTINYSYQNYSSGAGSGMTNWFKVFKNGTTVFSSQVCTFNTMNAAPTCYFVKFANDTVGYFSGNPTCNFCYDLYKTSNFAQTWTQLTTLCPWPTDSSKLAIVNNDAAYFVGGLGTAAEIRRVSDALGVRSFPLQTTLNDTVVYDSLFGSPFCSGQTHLNYAYIKGSDTVNYTIIFKINPSAVPNYNVSGIQIFPNPATDMVNIKGLLPGAVKIFDLMGSLLISRQIAGAEAQIDIGDLPQGIYAIECISEKKYLSARLVKQ